MQKGLAILRGKGYYIDNFHSRGFAPRENLKFKRVEIMNKSKFLKKSLAMLLALMLVVAMIPLSASAAPEGEYGSDPVVTVNTHEAELTGDTYAVTIQSDSTKVTLQGRAPVEAGEDADVVFIDKNDDEYENTANIDLEDVATETSDNVYSLNVELRVPDEDSEAVETVRYTLVVTFEKIKLNGNPAISALKNIDEDVLASYEIDADTISIVTKFGEEITSLTANNFVLAGTGASVTGSISLPTASTAGSVTVEAQDHTKKTYAIEITMRPGLESFEIEGQVGETKITPTGSGSNYQITVDVTMPYGTDLTKLVPTFEVGEDIDNVTDMKRYDFANGVDVLTIDSGKHALLLWKGDVIPNNATPAAQEGEDFFIVKVNATTAPNTAADLESIKVDTSNTTPVTGKTVAVEMPKNYSFGDNKTPKKVDVIVKGSENAKVEVLGQDVDVETITDGTATLENVNITSKSFKIRVTSAEEGATANEYTINLSAATVADTKLYVQAKKTGSDTIYEAEFDGEEGVLKLPYAARSMKEAANYTLYFSASTGATIDLLHINSTTAVANQDILTGKLDNLFITHGVDAERVFVVTNPTAGGDPEDNKTTYTLKLDFEPAQTDRILSSATLVNTNDVPKITPDGTYNTTVGTGKLADGTEVKTLRVAVPYTFTNGTTVWAKDLGLSEGAVAYVYYPGTSTADLVALDPKVKGAQDEVADIKITTDVDDGDTLNLTEDTATRIFVLSEKAYVDNFNNKDATKRPGQKDWMAENGTVYYVYGVRANPQTGADLKSIDSTLDENVDVNFDASRKEIEITVPWSYDAGNADKYEFTLNIKTSSMATAYAADPETSSDPLKIVSDLGDASNKADASKFNVDGGKLYWSAKGAEVTKIYVRSEDENTTTPYTVKVKVNEAEKGAQLLSVGASGVTGAIDSNRNIALTLPYGSTKYPVNLELEASKMATIYVGSYDKNKPTQNVYNPETGYDLNSDLPIIVVSENGQNHTEYTLKTTVAENFFDVANDQWYYDEVLKAAENKWVNGTKPGYFEPNGTMTRGDFALIIARIKNYNPALYTESAFPDVDSDLYYSAAIAFCADKGLIGGDGGNFYAERFITREEMAKIICNAAGVDQVTNPEKLYADDDTIAEWAKGYVYGCQAAAIMMGNENANTFDARSNATRAEAAAVLVRAFA